MTSARLLRLFILLASLTVIGSFAYVAWRDHKDSEHDAVSQMSEVTRLMEEHTNAALLVGTLQLNRVCELIGKGSVAQFGASKENWQTLQRLRDEVPRADSIWITDSKADVVANTLQWKGVSLNLADRAYFSAIRDGARDFISPLIWGKMKGGFYFAMSRRLEKPDGGFKGVAQISLKAEYFTDFYKTLRPDNGAAFAIIKTNGDVVVRYPLPEPGTENFPKPRLLLEQLSKADSGTFVAASAFDNVTRLFYFRRVAGQPLVVVAGLPVDTIFAPWRERTARGSILAVLALMTFLAIAYRLSQAMATEANARAHAESLVRDKQVLFQEIHHRVKNNLQIISSFLTMQALKAPDAATAQAFDEALSRINSMGLVHQVLYEQDEAADVSMDAYLHALATNVGQTYGVAQRGISIQVQSDGTCLPLNSAVPLAMLANEALINALKHAFPTPTVGGTISMAFHSQGESLTFTLADNGIGIPQGKSAHTGVGLHILSALARQLGGELYMVVEDGTQLSVTFPRPHSV